ncbi:MAG: carotenoid biosynthesis protein [Deltaproteobacteria bacterium]|nr:carotenoid biosynthesis protein [Deltaproteobacteria bacterium]
MFDPLIITIQHRPYVFLFLIVFLILATLHIGLYRAILWLLWGYLIAFVSEYSSIRNGFPYGLYHYIYEAMQGELILGGVPVWDSASYPFIAYASYSTACFLLEPRFRKCLIAPHLSPSRPFAVSVTGAILMMLADVVIDPVANLGEKWFLGKIYFYPHGGEYFGVPLTNFAGWLLVAFIIIAGFQILEKFLFARLRIPATGAKRFPYQALLGPLFYFGILGFNLAMTFYVGAYGLLAVSSAITAVLLVWLFRRLKRPFSPFSRCRTPRGGTPL